MKAIPSLIGFLALAVFTALTGCGPRQDDWPSAPLPQNAVAILTHGDEAQPEQDRATSAILRKAFPNATSLVANQLAASGPILRREGTVLVVPRVRELSPETWRSLALYLSRGGRALFWGLDPTHAPGDTTCTLLRPASEFFSFTTRNLRGLPAGTLSSAQPIRMQSPFPRPTGNSGVATASQRWIPLAEARDAAGAIQGWPASLWIEASTQAPLRAWGWIGWDADPAFARAQQALLQTAASRLYQRQFLIHAGLDRFALEANEPIHISAQFAATPAGSGPWRIVAEMENEQRVVTRRIAETISLNASATLVTTSLFFGAASRRADQPQRMTLRVALANPETGEIIDETRQPLRLRPENPSARAVGEDRIGARGSTFILGRRPSARLGARLVSHAATPHQNALDPDVFNLDLLRADLTRFRDAGINSLTVAYTSIAQAPQLRILLDELRNNQLAILLELPALSPWKPNESLAKEQLEALRLAPNSRIFAISPGPIAPPQNGEQNERLNAAWAHWIREQYGSPEHAQALLNADVQTFSPASLWDKNAGLSTELQLAARRFLNDFIARHYRACRNLLLASGWTGLFTAPSATTLDPAAGAWQLDFLSLDGAALDPTDPNRTAFFTAYARAVSGSKPILWFDVSATIPYPPTPDTLRTQAEQLDAQLRALVRTHAAGVILDRIVGGPLDADGLDRGLIRPDGAWRPSGDTLRARAQDWRHESLTIPPWRGREVDIGNAPGGLPELWTREKETAGPEATDELRAIGWDRLSSETPLLNLAGGPVQPPEPLQFFNAQWQLASSFETEATLQAPLREPLQMDVLNTGLSRWTASVTGNVGSVWISAVRNGFRPLLLPLRETAPGATAHLTWTPSDAGSWTLRPLIYPSTLFGEPLRVEVLDALKP
ncbi:MAG: hypothetical protein J5I99_08415 [Verrucomicrobia bacterium]|nr:hypothetical protein [Kiritimatiellia bacterium]MCO6401233.1 hypothetical protein [Verrucomicrobiota bacterium]